MKSEQRNSLPDRFAHSIGPETGAIRGVLDRIGGSFHCIGWDGTRVVFGSCLRKDRFTDQLDRKCSVQQTGRADKRMDEIDKSITSRVLELPIEKTAGARALPLE